ncbi:AraC family transcriptional regulator [Leucobacter albus]|uniref:AraC family transcriptional regulator n=1 Tax=Leucobacter albus TaxID=272210 RepID=A0ABW3TSB9_9MICO
MQRPNLSSAPATPATPATTAAPATPAVPTHRSDDELDWWGHDPHSHDEAQLLYAASGSCTVDAGGRRFTVDHRTAVWIAPHAVHSARFDDEFVPVSILPAPHRLDGGEACAIAVDAPLRTLLLRSARVSDFAALGQLSERLRGAPRIDAHAPEVALPRGPLTGPIVAAFVADPSLDTTLDEWAATLHCSVTSLRRAFLTETGVSFTEWRTRFRVERALPLLADGAQVSLVAARVGMTHNGFTNAFRRTLGHTPVAYRAA